VNLHLRCLSRFFFQLAVLFSCSALFAADHVRYSVSLVNPEKHLVDVTVEIPPGESARELQLPVWNALYQVRDFSQYMNRIRAEDSTGALLPLQQLNKSRWKISGAQNGGRVLYEMFADDPGPYGAQLNSHHAFFNLAEILCYIDGERASPVEIEFRDIPSGWKIATPLGQQDGTFSATNYDQLVDSPVEIGKFDERDFNADCGDYRVIVDSENTNSVFDKILTPVQRIVSTETKWMNDCPFKSYMFIYHFSDSPGDGGMEHAYSTAITLPDQYLSQHFDRFTNVTAHEFFHLWNVKRIRPQSLEPIDYTKANYTPALWFSEGVDSTVAGYIHVRAGLLDEKHYLNHLAREITEVEDRPAHSTQSAEQSSIDAWLEKYPYYNLPERSISYYNKGELLGVMLDLKMREASDDKVSLQDLFRWMNDHYAKQGKLFPDSAGVRDAAETLTHADFGEFFRKYVSGLDEIPWDGVFSRVGLRVMSVDVVFTDPGFDAERNFDQPPTVVQVEGGSGADESGLTAGDVIIQINGKSAGSDYEKVINDLGPGALLRLRILRNGSQHDLEWKLASRKQRVFQLEDVPGITAQQRSRRAAWLFGETAGFSASKQ